MRRTISPALSSTLTWREMAGCVILNGAASSLIVVSPKARRARIARRVGSASAAKAASRFSMSHLIYISINLYKCDLIVKKTPMGSQLISRKQGEHRHCAAGFRAGGPVHLWHDLVSSAPGHGPLVPGPRLTGEGQ